MLVIAFFSLKSFARVYQWPEVCENGTVTIQNKSSMDLRFFLQTFNPKLIDEEQLVVEARQKLSVAVRGPSVENPLKRLSLLSLENSGADYKVSFQCLAENYQASAHQSGQWTFKKNLNLTTHKIWIKNLSAQPSQYALSTYDSANKLLKTWSLQFEPNEQKSILLKESDLWTYFKFRSDTRAAVFYLDNYRNTEPVQFNFNALKNVDQNGVYFEVQNREKTEDSFIIHLNDADMIQKARAALANPKSEKIVVGEIQPGFGNYNVNLNSADRAPWSWHVSRVTSFSDFASTACNGLPQIVEDRVESWAKDPGRICFWTYRLKRELRPTEISRSGAIKK